MITAATTIYLRLRMRAWESVNDFGFIPPYEWYNARHVQWARDLDCVLFNFTPGSGSHRDWAPEGHRVFRPSAEILSDILACEERDSDGLNGHLLLLHLGSERRDKMDTFLAPLIDEVHDRRYDFLRVDTLLNLGSAKDAGGFNNSSDR